METPDTDIVLFTLPDDAFEEFLARLDSDSGPKPKLVALMSEPAPWDTGA